MSHIWSALSHRLLITTEALTAARWWRALHSPHGLSTHGLWAHWDRHSGSGTEWADTCGQGTSWTGHRACRPPHSLGQNRRLEARGLRCKTGHTNKQTDRQTRWMDQTVTWHNLGWLDVLTEISFPFSVWSEWNIKTKELAAVRLAIKSCPRQTGGRMQPDSDLQSIIRPWWLKVVGVMSPFIIPIRGVRPVLVHSR